MNIEDIKQQINELSKMHEAIDEMSIGDLKDAELIEIEAENLIVDYCEYHCYMIHGFPTEKRKGLDEGLGEEYFSRERFQLYLDSLAIEKDDVAEIWWYYNKIFWPDWFNSKEGFLNQIKEQLKSGYYDIEL